MIDPAKDGIDHINVYSKGKTALGRFLTNFAYSKIHTADGAFSSIEGYWYWLSTKDNALRDLYGHDAKMYGRKVGGKDWMDGAEFKERICRAIEIKLKNYPNYLSQLTECQLPLKHYYVYGDKVVEPKDGKWMLEFLSTYQRLNE